MGWAHSHTDGVTGHGPGHLVEEVMGRKWGGGSAHGGELPPHLLGQTQVLLSSRLWSAEAVGSISCKPSSWVLG